MNQGTDILTSLGLNLSISKKIIKEGDGPFQSCTATMVELSICKF